MTFTKFSLGSLAVVSIVCSAVVFVDKLFKTTAGIKKNFGKSSTSSVEKRGIDKKTKSEPVITQRDKASGSPEKENSGGKK